MIAIQVNCPCGKQFRVKPEAIGRSVKCPGCGERVEVTDNVPSLPDTTAESTVPNVPAISSTSDQSSIDLPEWYMEEPLALNTTHRSEPPTIPNTVPATITPSTPRKSAPSRRSYKAMQTVSRIYKGAAILVAALWAISAVGVIGLLFFGVLASFSTPAARPSLPPGVTADMNPEDPNLDFAQRLALISYLSYEPPNKFAALGGAVVATIPWLIGSLLMFLLAAFLWAAAEGIQLAIDVESNTYDAAYRT